MYKLLVVDDECEVRNAICNYFPWSEIGFEVIGQASDGQEALHFTHENIVDAVLCDIKMPTMTGIDLAKELYSKSKSIKIVFLSAYREFEYAQKALNFGVKNYIVKPTKYKELVEVFSKIKAELDQERSVQITQEPNLLSQEELKIYSFNKKIIETVIKYLKECYKDATLEDAAKLVHMSPNYLSQFFKSKTGQHFSDYVIMLKMQKAAELLKDISYKTYEVSYLVGYSNAKNFTRSFKNYFGKTPKDYRNSFNLD